jgi:alpha-D-ribose 1-methylphosphonate 5-triphosphate synthase subunit PhnL
MQRRKVEVVDNNFDYLRSEDKWFNLTRTFPGGANFATVVHRLTVSIIEGMNLLLVEADAAFRVRFNVPKKAGRSMRVSISTFGSENTRRKNIPILLSDYSILFADEKLVRMDSETSISMLVELIVGEIERFSAAGIDAVEAAPI